MLLNTSVKLRKLEREYSLASGNQQAEKGESDQAGSGREKSVLPASMSKRGESAVS